MPPADGRATLRAREAMFELLRVLYLHLGAEAQRGAGPGDFLMVFGAPRWLRAALPGLDLPCQRACPAHGRAPSPCDARAHVAVVDLRPGRGGGLGCLSPGALAALDAARGRVPPGATAVLWADEEGFDVTSIALGPPAARPGSPLAPPERAAGPAVNVLGRFLA